MLKKINQVLRRPFCEHVFHHSRSRPGFVVCAKCRHYQRG